MSRKKLLFFSHAVTLAHFTRLLKWIETLDRNRYDVYLASHFSLEKYSAAAGATFIPISCIDAEKFSAIVHRAGLIYDAATFENHVAEDMVIIDRVRPNLVIGDFRHSLSVSCRLRKVKYINLANAYWSPKTQLPYPLPESPAIRKLGETLSRCLLKPFLPIAVKFNFKKMANEIKASLESANLDFSDYRELMVDGDVTVYCDTPDLVPLTHQSQRERFSGPIVWSMPVDLPQWWTELAPTRRRIFVTLGSSGPASRLPLIIKTLARLDADIIVAKTGNTAPLPFFTNVYVTDFLPIEPACGNSDLVICNGGSPMAHAALTYGVPIIGIVCNNDQLLNMAHIEKRGAGKMLRFWNLSPVKLLKTVNQVLTNTSFQTEAASVRADFEAMDVTGRLKNIIAENI